MKTKLRKWIVETAVEANEVVLTGPVEMGGVNKKNILWGFFLY